MESYIFCLSAWTSVHNSQLDPNVNLIHKCFNIGCIFLTQRWTITETFSFRAASPIHKGTAVGLIQVSNHPAIQVGLYK